MAMQNQKLTAKDSGGLWYALRQERQSQEGRPLPKPTQDKEALKADLDTHGYCFLAEALSPDTARQINDRVCDQLSAERRKGLSVVPPEGYGIVSNLLNKGKIFQQLVLHEEASAIVAYLLGSSFILSALNASRTQPGSRAQGLHIDQHFVGLPVPVSLVANVCWMIDDFTEENGGTRIVPGSHLWSPEKVARHYGGINSNVDGTNPAGSIPAIGPAGTAMIFDGRLLHGTGRNVTEDRYRIGIFHYCCRGWIRPVENPFLSISDDVMETMPPELRARLGYKVCGYAGGYQMAGAPPPLDVVRPSTQIREIS